MKIAMRNCAHRYMASHSIRIRQTVRQTCPSCKYNLLRSEYACIVYDIYGQMYTVLHKICSYGPPIGYKTNHSIAGVTQVAVASLLPPNSRTDPFAVVRQMFYPRADTDCHIGLGV